MKISKLNPHGYCGGVSIALKKANDAIKNDNINKPIYMIGKIIHNDIVCKSLEDQGVIIKTNNKLDAINEINSGTVIFTAHGIDESIIELAISKNLNVIDTTCSKVSLVKNNIKKHINTHTIIYIGVKNHPECEAILSISNDIILITCIEDLIKLDKEKKYYVTNQTTLSLFKIDNLYSYIADNFSNVVIDNKICLATTTRQQAIIKCDSDCIVVVGDKLSSNTNELYNISSSKCTAFLVSNYVELINIDFNSYSNIKITSGASTPEYLVDEVVEFLSKTYL